MSLLLACGWAGAQPLVIDDFSTELPPLIVGGVGQDAVFIDTAGSDIVGGQRDVFLAVNSGTQGIVEVTGGDLLISAVVTTNLSAQAVYDGADDDAFTIDPSGLGSIDLTNGTNQNALLVNIGPTSLPTTINISVFSGSNASAVSYPLVAFPTAVDFVVPFTHLAVSTGSGADFTAAGAIEVELAGTGFAAVIGELTTTAMLSAQLSDALQVDADMDTVVSAGDTLRYTAVIENVADALAASATNVAFSITPDADSTLLVGSVTTTQGTIDVGNVSGDTAVLVTAGTIVDNGTVIITFDVLVLATGIGDMDLSVQGTLSSDQGPSVSDDPDDATSTVDPTVTVSPGLPVALKRFSID